MPAAVGVAKGIILSISIIAALGIAVIENPQIQEWLEEQRRRIVELLRQIGDELDPQSRQAAEAFAFEGRTPANDEGIRREAVGSQDAAAFATGRSLSPTNTIRRIPVRGPTDPDEAEERRRKGREYLAQRNQQMYELQQRRKAAKAEGTESPPTPTFDSMVDSEGNWKELELSSPPSGEPIPDALKEEMKEVERQLSQPLLIADSGIASSSAWNSGSHCANPFGDEYALDRSETPRPPAVPPKIELDRIPSPPISVPGSFDAMLAEPQSVQEEANHEGLSYEEQLAIALSLSEQENSANSATVRQNQTRSDEEDDELRRAIAASLNDMDDQQAAHAIAHAETAAPQPRRVNAQTLIDLATSVQAPSRAPQGEWGHLLDQSIGHFQAPSSATARSETSDELYNVTPKLTQARLAGFDARHVPGVSFSSRSDLPFDPIRDTARVQPQWLPEQMESSFYSAREISPAASDGTLDHKAPQLIDLSEGVPQDDMRTPTLRAQSSVGFQTDSDSDTFAFASAPASRAPSRAESEVSNIEVVDIVDDSDVDMLSEEGDGIATPDSWSEVDADSDAEEDMQRLPRVSS